MSADIGWWCLVLALALALVLSVFPLYGALTQRAEYQKLASPLAFAVFLFTLLAYLSLSWAFYHDDFSLRYVASHSNRLLPWYYKLSAVWGGHEGSLLLWVWIQAGWLAAVAKWSQKLPEQESARLLAVMGMICAGFLLFIIATSNPFERTFPAYPVDGVDLNPLLQDPGLILHPPLLYMGYVGFSVSFAFAISALISGNLDGVWARWSRPWTTLAWLSLTLGIALGSWWAYTELGWGGWWFWDPVENASLMPWLAGTALLHSLAVTEKRATFKAWTVLLAIMTFSLSLLGTFLVRSGVLVSVHSFAADPQRGLFILALLCLVIGGSLLLFALRGQSIRSSTYFSVLSRENALLLNNLLLMTALVIVFVGTLFPLVYQQIGWGDLSIGAPFYNQLFALLSLPLMLVLGLTPLIRWRQQPPGQLYHKLLMAGLFSFTLSVMFVWLSPFEFYWLVWLIVVLCAWVCILHGVDIHTKATQRHAFFKGLRKLKASYWAMQLGHLGLLVTIIGITFVEHYSTEREVRMTPSGASYVIAGFQVTFDSLSSIPSKRYDSLVGRFSLRKEQTIADTLVAEKRYYRVAKTVMTEVGLYRSLWGDVYIALGEPLEDGQTWAIRLYHKPLIAWIWGGAILMALAGLIAVADKRYRLKPIGVRR
ncbi:MULTISPECIES: heme lyase CcmF/NrfE family subunit [unclassified Vibrio]|uniref:Heme lyase CcmF/NrfE family subunit n=1 Tax=Vibrio sp. HB236076 TaxID=3232307 RepID=A0AB39HJA9_9VIBR|nr:heme lyase CcmF/NrfE family subunit [Vibrio sp. HB161653]MDP5254769.1 heme lyase CcmF/NrfE family subunit [Vibrio sp. HB161653]